MGRIRRNPRLVKEHLKMESQFVISESESKLDLYIRSPFFLRNIAEFKKMGGRFSRMDKTWHFPNTPSVQRALDSLFGEASPFCVAVVPQEIADKNGNEWSWRGYKLASRRYRTTPVEMPRGVNLHSGSFDARNEKGEVSGKNISFAVVMRKSAANSGGLEILEESVCSDNGVRFLGLSDKELLEEAKRRGLLGLEDCSKNQKEEGKVNGGKDL